ncbi:MAG: Rap1a/Tai family immunity protein [Phenylobacterium sp.]
MLGLLLAATLAASPQPPVMFNFFDASDLLGHCAARDANAAMRQSLCFGYVAGALDQVMMQQAALTPDRRTVCPPTDLTLNAAILAVLDHASWAAREEGLGASGLVKFALEQAYPCAPSQTGV